MIDGRKTASISALSISVWVSQRSVSDRLTELPFVLTKCPPLLICSLLHWLVYWTDILVVTILFLFDFIFFGRSDHSQAFFFVLCSLTCLVILLKGKVVVTLSYLCTFVQI